MTPMTVEEAMDMEEDPDPGSDREDTMMGEGGPSHYEALPPEGMDATPTTDPMDLLSTPTFGNEASDPRLRSLNGRSLSGSVNGDRDELDFLSKTGPSQKLVNGQGSGIHTDALSAKDVARGLIDASLYPPLSVPRVSR